MLTNDRSRANPGRSKFEVDDFFEVPREADAWDETFVEELDPEEASDLLDEPLLLETEELQDGLGLEEMEGSGPDSSLIIDPQTLVRTRGAFENLGMVLLFSLPVLLIAVILRLINFGKVSAYMDEGIYIVTGRTLIEHNIIYDNALQWTFGSLLYPLISGWLDIRGGLNASRLFSVFWGVAMVQATIFTTIGLFKLHPSSKEQEIGDFSVISKPVVAGLLAGLIVAVLPTVNALSRFATYDAMAAGLFSWGFAAFVWALRENAVALKVGDKRSRLVLGLLAGSAVCFFLAFLAKYLIAMYFPFLCVVLLINGKLRVKGLLAFILPLSVACGLYYLLFSEQLNKLLAFAHQYEDLRSDNFFQIYLFDRLDIMVLLLLGYWGMRQAFRDKRGMASLLLWGCALLIIGFQLISRADYDYWKHTAYIILLLSPLAGWLFSDWSWWDEPNQHPQPGLVARTWKKFKNSGLFGQEGLPLEPFEHRVAGNTATERAKSISLALTLAFLLTCGGVLWSVSEVPKLLGHWPQLTDKSVENIRQLGLQGGPVLVDDTALNYYLYGIIPTSYIFTPFSFTYNNQEGIPAYIQAVNDRKFNLVILDGGATTAGAKLWESLQPVLKASPAYIVVYSEPLQSPNLDGSHKLEIYRLLSPDEQAAGLKEKAAAVAQNTSPTPAAAAIPPTATVPVTASPASLAATVPPRETVAVFPTPTTVAPEPTATPVVQVFPANPSYNFDNGDEGWGLLPDSGPLEPGTGVSPNSTYKLANHASLKFTPQPENKLYTVGVNREGDFQKITMLVYIPADKADYNVRVGMYYFDKKWTWIDDGFQGEIVPGQWTQLTWQLPAKSSMKQFGLKLAGFSGSVYINGVSVE